jgi:hypothetical protein
MCVCAKVWALLNEKCGKIIIKLRGDRKNRYEADLHTIFERRISLNFQSVLMPNFRLSLRAA